MKLKLIIVLYALCFSEVAVAACSKVTSTSLLTTDLINKGYTATSWTGACDTCTGNLGLPSVISINTGSNFQPAGTLLASATGGFLTQATNNAYTANQILYRCELADADSLYEMYATNGDNAYTGMYTVSDVDGAYYDVAMNVAVRMTNLSTGEYYSRYWKQRQLSSSDWVQDDTYIYIPASAFSNVLYEMYKTDDTLWKIYISGRDADWYSQPRGYIAFKGPGLDTNYLTSGADSATVYFGWYHNWPGGWSTYGNVTYVRGALCQVSNYPSVVLIPTISINELSKGETSQTSFNLSLECESGTISSVSTSTTSSANVALGFLVNNATAVSAATTLGLTSTSGLTHLLDTNYGSSGVASGVGIRIYDQNGSPMNLLSSQTMGTGNSGGWYSYADIMNNEGESTSGLTTYTGSFVAAIEAISGETVTAGTINAQLQVIVSFQ
ncbi:fimbrial usher protein StbD [Enterobacter cancerogenus]|uniref:fimbrial usher protein StbD n=1 Tax=Enterobacter cancerogenus TaxID=69218 RepID=UPI001299669F|nr:fimbrial usher protein StbD [Enterobacter cancerogenus]MRG34118.1 fimbrial usher protein StbD [Enterobacter cancerogenus]